MRKGGYREVLKIAFPLILSTGSWSLQHFIDRVFLTWYSPEAIAAAMPASLANWTLVSLLMGTAAYVNTFVAQYYGAGQPERIGAAVWQGIYLAGFAVIEMALIYPFSDFIFAHLGHTPAVARLEANYFKILLWGAPFVVIANAISGFFSGRGKTWIVMWINFAGTAVNIAVDYLLIFGKWGFPEMGISGAGVATVLSAAVVAILFFVSMMRPRYQRLFGTLKNCKPDSKIFRRLLRYGLPSGLQFMLDILTFTLFIILVGHIGMRELAASNIAFNINTLAFLPMMGLSIAISTLVGQRLGENQPNLAERSAWSGFHLSFGYFGLLAFGYFFFPGLFLWPFKLSGRGPEFQAIQEMSILLLRFIAIYSLFDAANMSFAGALKGAGDTRFVAGLSVALGWSLMLIPGYIALKFFGSNVYWLWGFVTLYIAFLGIALLLRFRHGLWKKMRVIESQAG